MSTTIIAGEFSSRQLSSPEGDTITRPMPARVKESVFSILRGWFDGANVLDLFAGVGTVGLEAVSRGAASVLMVEKDRRIYNYLQENVEAIGCGDRAKTLLGDALGPTCLLRASRPVDLIFLDPPYALMNDQTRCRRVFDQIKRSREVMGDKGFVILRSPSFEDESAFIIDGFDGPEPHEYGPGMWVLLYAPAEMGA